MNYSVIIPSKTLSNLTACVAAIREHEPELEPHQIVVVDDEIEAGSNQPLGIAKFCLANNYSWVRGFKPFVYSRNINLGIAFSTRDVVPDGYVLLNDDALLQSPRGFSIMAQAASDHPEYGIIGATTNCVGNPNQYRKGVGLRDEPRMVCFVCVYIPHPTIERVGLLDERYVGYGMDDDDYSFEVRKAGLKIGVHDGCFVDHLSLKSSYRGDPQTPADFNPNLRRFINKWGYDNWERPA
jgi:GT2 family glycosyltransferase